MWLKNLQYNLDSNKKVFWSYLSKNGFEWNYWGGIILMLMIIILLSVNIYNVYDRGKTNFDQLIAEKEKLEELQIEGKMLEEEVQYRRSLQYVESFAQENLYMGRLGERLFKFDREEREIYELRTINTDPIEIEDNANWWKEIFFL